MTSNFKTVDSENTRQYQQKPSGFSIEQRNAPVFYLQPQNEYFSEQNKTQYKYYGRDGREVIPKERIYVRRVPQTAETVPSQNSNSARASPYKITLPAPVPRHTAHQYNSYDRNTYQTPKNEDPITNPNPQINGFSANKNHFSEHEIKKAYTFAHSSNKATTSDQNSEKINQMKLKFGSFKKNLNEESITPYEKMELKNRISQLEEEIKSLRETQLKSILNPPNKISLISGNKDASLHKTMNSRLRETGELGKYSAGEFGLISGESQYVSEYIGSEKKSKQFEEYFGRNLVPAQSIQDSSISRHLKKGDSKFFANEKKSPSNFFDSINSSYYHELGAPQKNFSKDLITVSREQFQEQKSQIQYLNERISQLERASKTQADYLKQKASIGLSSKPISPHLIHSPLMSRTSTRGRFESIPMAQSINISETPVIRTVREGPVRKVYHTDPNCPRISQTRTEIQTIETSSPVMKSGSFETKIRHFFNIFANYQQVLFRVSLDTRTLTLMVNKLDQKKRFDHRSQFDTEPTVNLAAHRP